MSVDLICLSLEGNQNTHRTGYPHTHTQGEHRADLSPEHSCCEATAAPIKPTQDLSNMMC